MTTTKDVSGDLIADVTGHFIKQKTAAEGAMSQVDDHAFFVVLGDGGNSIAMIAKHMAGNLRSRFSDFLTTDGEKPDRNRDGEFEIDGAESRALVMAQWERGWNTLFETLRTLTPTDLGRTVHVRGEAASVQQSLLRALAHQAQHAGQIVLLAKYLAGDNWETLTIPRRVRAESSARDAPAKVVNNERDGRYELQTPDGPAVLEYMREGSRLALVHTGVPKSLEGRGLAAALVRTALDDARANGLRVIPMCAYVRAFIAKHPEYAPLVGK